MLHQTAACCINISQFKKLSCATAVTCNHYFAALQTTVVASTTASQRSSPAPPRIVFFKSMHVPHLFVWTLQVLSLWLHETCRVFEDRLTCQEDHDWFRWGISDSCQLLFSAPAVLPSRVWLGVSRGLWWAWGQDPAGSNVQVHNYTRTMYAYASCASLYAYASCASLGQALSDCPTYFPASRTHQKALVQEHFGLDYGDVVPTDCLMYGNYLVPGAEPKVS